MPRGVVGVLVVAVLVVVLLAVLRSALRPAAASDPDYQERLQAAAAELGGTA